MNRSKVLQFLLAVSLAVTGATKVQAETIVGGPHNQACASCHNAFVEFDATKVRINCVSCHSHGSAAKRTPFSEEAMANPYNSTSNVTPLGEGSWRSHNWDSVMLNPAAGAGMPVNTNMTKQYKYYSIPNPINPDPAARIEIQTCARCHRIHEAELTYVNGVLDPPNPYQFKGLLRDWNDKDQMCYNCHQDRVQPTAQINGSHPVGINYTSAWRTNTQKYASFAKYTQSFFKKPRNKNILNPTSQLSNYFIDDGKIGCSTCHSVHYGDSDSLTFDNRSTASGHSNAVAPMSRTMSHSTGMLLRTDEFGANATDINICTNCHKDQGNTLTKTHNNTKTANQGLQCNNCHEAHVALDLTSTRNIKLIVRQVNYSSAFVNAKNKTINFTASTQYYKSQDNTGVCQVCHAVPFSSTNNPRTNKKDYPSLHDKATAVAGDCNGCHPHNGADGGFSFSQGGCSGCHGYPPPAAAFANHSVAERNTPHRLHSAAIAQPIAKVDNSKYGYKCVECHYDSLTPDHLNGVVNTFKEVGPVGTKFGSTPNLANNCATVYCHSNGAPGDDNANIRYQTQALQWYGGTGAIVNTANECKTCHGDTTSLTTGSHAMHLSKVAAKCSNCHSGTANGTGVLIKLPKNLHADGNKDLSFSRPEVWTGGFSGTYKKTNKTASVPSIITCSVSCHFNPTTSSAVTTAQWGLPSSGACGTCHATSNSIAVGFGTISSGAHRVHLNSVSGPTIGLTLTSCQVCHMTFSTATNHVNGVREYTPSACFPCHPSSAGTPAWANAAAVTCRSCHVGDVTKSIVGTKSGPFFNSFTTGGHGSSFNGIGGTSGTIAKIDCDGCHDNSMPHINSGLTTHRLPGTLATQNTLICGTCHNEAWSAGSILRTKLINKTHVITSGEVNPSALCTACHDSHGTGNQRMIKSSISFDSRSTAVNIAFTNPSSGFVNATNNRGLCQVCHTKTSHFKRGIAEPTSLGSHGDAEHRKCLSCHDHQPPDAIGKNAFAPTSNCDSCHGFPPAATMTSVSGPLARHNNYSTAGLFKYANSGGAHTVEGHVGKDATIKNQTNANCSNCHFKFDEHNKNGNTVIRTNMKLVINPKFKFNATLPVQFDRTSATCSNVSCHYSVTPKWQ